MRLPLVIRVLSPAVAGVLSALQAAAETPAYRPQQVSCEAGLEESFGDRPRPFFTIDVDADPRRGQGPTALLTRWLNDGLQPYGRKRLFQQRVSGRFQTRGAELVFVSKGWTLLFAADAANPEAKLLLDGKEHAARCVFHRALQPATPALELVRSPEFQEHWRAARDALSDDFQLLYGPIATAAAGDELRVEVALRKQRTRDCSARARAVTPRLPFATVTATLRRDSSDAAPLHTGWRVEQLESKITDPSPPAESELSADELAAALAKRYAAARTFEARFAVVVDKAGIFLGARTAGTLRADAARGVSVRARDYRQVEASGQLVRVPLPGARGPSGPGFAYRPALAFFAADLGDHFELARDRSRERCSRDYILVATPKGERSLVGRIVLSIDRATFIVHEAQVWTPPVHYGLTFEHEELGVATPEHEFELPTPSQ